MRSLRKQNVRYWTTIKPEFRESVIHGRRSSFGLEYRFRGSLPAFVPAQEILHSPRFCANPVDRWRAIECLVALGWAEAAIAVALALTPRRVKQLRLFANVLPAMLDQMVKGDMPNEQQLRTIASA